MDRDLIRSFGGAVEAGVSFVNLLCLVMLAISCTMIVVLMGPWALAILVPLGLIFLGLFTFLTLG